MARGSVTWETRPRNGWSSTTRTTAPLQMLGSKFVQTVGIAVLGKRYPGAWPVNWSALSNAAEWGRTAAIRKCVATLARWGNELATAAEDYSRQKTHATDIARSGVKKPLKCGDIANACALRRGISSE